MEAKPVALILFRGVSSIPGQGLNGTSAPLSLNRLRRATSIAQSSSMLFPAGAMKDSASSGVSPSPPSPSPRGLRSRSESPLKLPNKTITVKGKKPGAYKESEEIFTTYAVSQPSRHGCPISNIKSNPSSTSFHSQLTAQKINSIRPTEENTRNNEKITITKLPPTSAGKARNREQTRFFLLIFRSQNAENVKSVNNQTQKPARTLLVLRRRSWHLSAHHMHLPQIGFDSNAANQQYHLCTIQRGEILDHANYILINGKL